MQIDVPLETAVRLLSAGLVRLSQVPEQAVTNRQVMAYINPSSKSIRREESAIR